MGDRIPDTTSTRMAQARRAKLPGMPSATRTIDARRWEGHAPRETQTSKRRLRARLEPKMWAHNVYEAEKQHTCTREHEPHPDSSRVASKTTDASLVGRCTSIERSPKPMLSRQHIAHSARHAMTLAALRASARAHAAVRWCCGGSLERLRKGEGAGQERPQEAGGLRHEVLHLGSK